MHLERQSSIRYLKTEVDLSKELGMPIRCPIRFFDLQGLGIDQDRFLHDLRGAFHRLAWDMYDVKREQVFFLQDHYPDKLRRLQVFLARYFRDEAGLRDVADLLAPLPDKAKREFEKIRSYRRRSIARFVITKRDTPLWKDEWHVVRTECTGFTQDVVPDDPRVIERIFDPTSVSVVQHPEFQKLLIGVAEMVEDAEEEAYCRVRRMTLTFHKMGLTAAADTPSTNAPEGIHKDGADYIVSALVIERSGVDGGVSVIYGPDKKTKLLEVTLQPGQGLFQADQHSTLWHDVTPIQLKDPTTNEGVRNIFGFDINVERY